MYRQIVYDREGVTHKVNILSRDAANEKWRTLREDPENSNFFHYEKTVAVYVVFGRKEEARKTIIKARDDGKPVPKYLYEDWEKHTPGEEVLVDARGFYQIATVLSSDEIEQSAMKKLYDGPVKQIIVLNRQQKEEW